MFRKKRGSFYSGTVPFCPLRLLTTAVIETLEGILNTSRPSFSGNSHRIFFLRKPISYIYSLINSWTSTTDLSANSCFGVFSFLHNLSLWKDKFKTQILLTIGRETMARQWDEDSNQFGGSGSVWRELWHLLLELPYFWDCAHHGLCSNEDFFL